MTRLPKSRARLLESYRSPLLPLLIVLLCVFFASVANSQIPDPAQMAARESHEGLTIAADPYTDALRVKEKFGKKHPYDAGLLPVEVFFKNDTNKAIRVQLEEIRLVISPPGSPRQRIEPLDYDTVIEKTLHKEKGGPELKRPRLPVPLPRSAGNDRTKDWKKLEEAWMPYLLTGDVLPPQSTMRGFLFFDMGRQMEWAAHSRLLVPKLKFLEGNQELFFFEVDLAKALPKQ